MKKLKKIVFGLVLMAAGLLLVSLILSQKYLSVWHDTYRNAKVTTAIRAVQLTDLHNYQYGRENQRPIDKNSLMIIMD